MSYIIGCILRITILEFIIFLPVIATEEGLSFFNPIRNYKKWYLMNWFGVIFFTLLLNIILPTLAFVYWFYKICTFGRRI